MYLLFFDHAFRNATAVTGVPESRAGPSGRIPAGGISGGEGGGGGGPGGGATK